MDCHCCSQSRTRACRGRDSSQSRCAAWPGSLPTGKRQSDVPGVVSRRQRRQTVTIIMMPTPRRERSVCNVADRWGETVHWNGGVDQWCVHGRAWVACGRRKEAALGRLDARSRRRRRAFARDAAWTAESGEGGVFSASRRILRDEKGRGEGSGTIDRGVRASGDCTGRLGDWERHSNVRACGEGWGGIRESVAVGERDR